MDIEQQEAIKARLVEYGLRLVPERHLGLLDELGLDVRLEHAKGADDFTGFYAPSMTVTALPNVWGFQRDPAPLVLGNLVHEKTAGYFRHEGVNYLDAAGNAHLEFGGVLIDVRGRRQPAPPDDDAKLVVTNLFATKKAQVIFALLSWPELVAAPLRMIAGAAGVSLGQAQETVVQLERTRFLREGKTRTFENAEGLFHAWTASYPSGLGSPRRILRSFAGEPAAIHAETESVFLGGEAAVETLRARTATIWVDEFTTRLAVTNRWRSDREPNIFIRQKFWNDPARPLSIPGRHPAPPLLVYAELLASRDPRVNSVAREYIESIDELRRLQ